MKKLTDEELYKNYQKRKVLRWLVMLFAFLTILFVLIYYITLNYAYVFIGLIFFIINIILNKYREKIPINIKEDKKEKKEVKKKNTSKKKKTK